MATKERNLALDVQLQQWADGKATLKQVRGYAEEELYAVARIAHVFFMQGKLQEARTLFQGLYAVDPVNPYYARALAVVEFAAGNPKGALAAYDVAVRLDPDDAAALLGRAEVRFALDETTQGRADLERALRAARQPGPLRNKIVAMLRHVR